MGKKKKVEEPTLFCPECGSPKVTVTAEQMFMANTGEHYCHSAKTHDRYAKANCLDCGWAGERHQFSTEAKKEG